MLWVCLCGNHAVLVEEREIREEHLDILGLKSHLNNLNVAVDLLQYPLGLHHSRRRT